MAEALMDVLFVCSNPSYRTYKTAKALSLTGECSTHILTTNWEESTSHAFKKMIPLGSVFWKFFSAYRLVDFYLKGKGDFLIKPFFKMMLSRKMNKVPEATLIHVVAPPPALTKAVMEATEKPTIFDQYDLFLQSYGDSHPWVKEVKDEIYCLEHADALVHKGPKAELDFYKEQGYSPQDVELSFPDGCDEDLFRPTGGKKLRDKDGQWHIVYVGGLHGSDKYYYLLPMFKRLAEQNVHTHVYPAKWSFEHEKMDEYKAFSEDSQFFHLHEPIPYEDLLKELTLYDFGLYYFDYDPVKWPGPLAKLKTAAGNKIPTYYEAGIPVIIGERLEYSSGFVSRYGAGFVIDDKDIDELGNRMDGTDMQALWGAVENAREDMSLKHQGRRLLDFYKKVLSNKK